MKYVYEKNKSYTDIQLKNIANHIRKDIILMLNNASSGHTGGALGLSDIFTVLYFDILKHNPKKPDWKLRDYLFLSNGHVCPVLYCALAYTGYFDKKLLMGLRKIGSTLQGHPHINSVAGIENTSGPLGQGISQAVGLAVSLKRDNKNNKIFCVMGDGELEEGQCWEAFMYAGKEKLSNLTIIIDRNFIQIDGDTEIVSHLEPLGKKFLSFGFAVIDIDGNNISQIRTGLKAVKNIKDKPVCIIADTIMGKGVSFMENDSSWHGKAPNDEETKKALLELDSKREENKKMEVNI